jgi:protein SCO1/2
MFSEGEDRGVQKPNVRPPRALVWIAAALLSAACMPPDDAASNHDHAVDEDYGPILQDVEIGGDFTLTAHTGEEFRLEDQRGKAALVFFGYTSCPDICPITMSKLTQAFRQVDGEKEDVVVLFVTVDVDRDTPEALAEYLGYFGLNSFGLTGSREQVDEVVAQYGAAYQIEDTGSEMGPMVAHSTYLYLIDHNGRVRNLFMHADTPEWIAAGVNKVLAEANQ